VTRVIRAAEPQTGAACLAKLVLRALSSSTVAIRPFRSLTGFERNDSITMSAPTPE